MTNESKRDWENFFKPYEFVMTPQEVLEASKQIKDYDESYEPDRWTISQIVMSNKCNEAIRKELEKAPRVYGTFTEDLKRAKFSGPLDWTERYHLQPSHTARLICIEEIKRDPISDPNKGD